MTIEESAAYLRERDRFLILNHRRPDGDALGSAAALCRGLRSMGKTACILANPQTTERYIAWTKPCEAPEGYTPDCVVAVDLADEAILQLNGDAYRGGIDLAIDHHPSNSGYAKQTLLLPERASCGEAVYLLLLALGVGVDETLATLLYIAVTTDTGCFRYKNTTAETLRAGAALLEAGASVDINRRLFMKKSPARLRLEAAIIQGLEFFQDGEACFGVVSLADMAALRVTETDMEDIAAVAGQVEGVEISVTLREVRSGEWKISVRTGDYPNADAICREFGGGGHGMAAGGTVYGRLDEAKAALREAVRKHWKRV